MRRREFITLIGGAAFSWPLAARAQQPAKLPTIGYLGTAAASAWAPWTAAFVQRLHELGWIEGRTITIQYRWAEGRTERYAEIAAEFVRLKVDVIVSGGNAAVAAKQASTIVPIVFTMVDDPVGSGLIASLARPGGNVTGLAINHADLAGKRLALLCEVVPGLHRVGIMANVEYPFAVLEVGEFETAARTLGAARVPTMHVVRELVEAGGLMSYGPNFPDLFRRAADHVDKILRGTKPGEIPVEQPSKFDLVINLTTAKALGLTVPESFLLRADEVIE